MGACSTDQLVSIQTRDSTSFCVMITPMEVKKAFKFRIYPNSSQHTAPARQFGNTHIVYNHYLAMREGYYLVTGTSLNYNDCAMNLVGRLKVNKPWLKEADSQIL